MVYSSSRAGTRTLIKAAVLCALVFTSVSADGSSSSTAAEVCGISDGDKSVGIRAIEDTSCASGGLGCFNDHCRFCKLIETPQSSAFEKCTTFGVEFPTMAPLVPSTGACEVSSGDAAVGISAFTDANCLYGGLGCFNDHCRFCKLTTTAQSEAFVDCPNNSTAGSSTDAPVDTTTSAASTSASTSIDMDGCTLVPAAGDVEVGISIGTDATCSAGGLGCINDVCRFCRIRTTTKSAAYTDCSILGTSAAPTDAPTDTPAATTETPTVAGETPAATPAALNIPAETPVATTEVPAGSTSAATTDAPVTSADIPAPTTAAPAADSTCTITASVGDAAVGISIVTDPTCVSGGIGCMNDVCRFCKVTTSTQSAAFMDCSLFASDASTSGVPVADNSDLSDEGDTSTDDSNSTDASTVADTPAVPTDVTVPTETPAATTETPSATVETPAATTATPVATTTTAAQPTCSQTVSAGDAAVGINIVTDASCSAGGVGCIDDVCRFCKVTETTQSAAFVDCKSIGGSTTSTEAPAATDAATEVPTETPTEAPTQAPVDASTDAPTEAPTDAPANAATAAPTSAPTGATCTQTVSEGDAAVGINIITDASCSAGGVGCIDDVCRFCKVSETPQSAAFVDCTSSTGATTATPAETPAATNAATEAPTETPTDAPTDAPTSSPTDAPTSSPTDAPTSSPTDAPTDAPTEAPAATPTATDPATDAPTSAPTGATCTQTVSEGDAAVGINIVTDASCSAGGVGCIDDVCRFCKTSETSQSAAFVECSSISGSVSTEALTNNDEALTITQEKATQSTADNVEYLSGEQIGAAVAGCVGAVAAVAVVARAAKRSAGNPNEPADVDDEVDDTENGKRVSPGPVPTEDPTLAEA